MIRGMILENYKSFGKLDLNLQKGGEPKSVVAIYGENGSGKSNIISVFKNLILSFQTLNNQDRLLDFQSNIPKNNLVDKTSLLEVFEDSYMLDTTDDMRVKINFQVNDSDGYYELIFKKVDGKPYLYSEELYYLIKKASGTVFKIKGTKNGPNQIEFSPSLFANTKFRDLAQDMVNRLWGKHSFLAIFNNLIEKSNKEYVESNVSANFLNLIRTFNTVAFRGDDSTGVNTFNGLLPDMIKGTLNKNQSDELITTTSNALNKYLVPLYSDLMEVYYQTERTEEGIHYELFERKRMGGRVLNLPFRLESHGTKELLKLFPLFLNAVNGKTVVIDEIDQGIHDLLVDTLVDNLKDDIEGQLIFTTHDTEVMKELDVSALYVIQIDINGNKKVETLSKNNKRNIAAHNNIQKKYLEGYFAGIPYSSEVDFYDILNDLEV
ncbi:AAA family ATPase [Companilactobacillus suantsaicola]|nr:ATP-binding protein [Companilactobacillus suantsaicola]